MVVEGQGLHLGPWEPWVGAVEGAAMGMEWVGWVEQEEEQQDLSGGVVQVDRVVWAAQERVELVPTSLVSHLPVRPLWSQTMGPKSPPTPTQAFHRRTKDSSEEQMGISHSATVVVAFSFNLSAECADAILPMHAYEDIFESNFIGFCHCIIQCLIHTYSLI